MHGIACGILCLYLKEMGFGKANAKVTLICFAETNSV